MQFAPSMPRTWRDQPLAGLRRRWSRRRLAAGLLALLALVLGPAAAAAAFFGTAALTSSVPTIVAASVATSVVAATLTLKLALRVGRWPANWHIALGGGVLVATLMAVSSASAFRPEPVEPLAPRPDTQYWALSTGSLIAYTHVPARGAVRPEPIVYLHGGPGGTIEQSTIDLFAPLADDGFDVYLYDQVGSGLSGKLPNVRDYTVGRMVADLEAIREQLGAERMVLVGQSWGGILAAHYLAEHPDRVERVVFASPGPLDGGGQIDLGLTAAPAEEPPAPPRYLLYSLLVGVNPDAAVQLFPQAEMGQLRSRLVSQVGLGQLYCARDANRVPRVQVRGQGAYVSDLVLRDLARTADVRPLLATDPTPALVLRGECDFVPFDQTYTYHQALPNSELIVVPGVGHSLWATQAESVRATITRFLLRDQP